MSDTFRPDGPVQRSRFHATGWQSWIVGAAIVLALVVLALRSSEEREIYRLAREASPWWTLVALVLQASTYFFQGELWRVVTRAAGVPLAVRTVLAPVRMTAPLAIEARIALVRPRIEQVARVLPGLQYAMTDARGLRFEHCVGLPLNWLHPLDDARFDEDPALAAVLKAHPRLRHPPGTRYLYSNLGYWLLGKLIERASGSRYERYVEDTLLGPLEVSRTELCFAGGDLACLARGNERAWSLLGLFARLATRPALRDGRDGPWLRFARVAMDGSAYGGLFATARGFCGFLRAELAAGRCEPLGWGTGDLAGIRYLGKPGGGPGFCGNVRLYPSVDIATAWFANRMQVSEAKIVALTNAIDEAWLKPPSSSLIGGQSQP